ncbi:ethylbenzene dehydrogenase-related protein [Hydrogenimonas thermophila]|uniref:ethylbenzene dehydrogenase-related protein n=1 Tax=Hydrogenimonas thermophila TaxID=223786 RepID=UPI00293733DA|nr:ethylbenzene dehydrogenase-related protein [Hydrogenimonas thermophila]WOE70021.1 ethylbenzene dehydrogenase-related protein [Hydrogenimonas thermophila]WOE72538.1 ethylbenzene dehydrogenase-related protein [Hydrogenimonas thermophila]
MNKLTTALLATSLVASAALAEGTVLAQKTDGDVTKLTPTSSAWEYVKGTTIHLYPQTTVTMNDKKANALNKNAKAKEARVKAIYDGKNIAFLLEWPDGTKSVQQGYRSDVYGDGFAVQLPVNYKDPKKLPYIGMGSEGRPVIIHLQKAVQPIYEPNGNGNVGDQQNVLSKNKFGKDIEAYNEKVSKLAVKDYQRSFISEGFRSMTEIKDGSEKFSADMSYGNNTWKGTVIRPLKDSYLNLKGSFPVAFAAWDGSKLNRDGLKLLSSWIPVKLVGQSGGDKLVAELTAPVKGDAQNGKNLVMQNGCIGCHYIPGMSAPGYMAPGLANIGGYATAAYLRESIVDPNAVVVPGYNRNAHPNTPWYNEVDGKRQSTMPPYPLDDKSLDDMVAYLKTLKSEVK